MFWTKAAMGFLGTIAVSATTLAFKSDPSDSAAPLDAELNRTAQSLATPVLSPRRVPALIAQPLGERRLSTALESVWTSHSSSSCLVVSEGSHVLYSRQGEQSVTPASALKLLTASAVLRRLGPDERLVTTVRATDKPNGGVISGDLWLVGGGDPVLGTQPWADERTHQPPLASSLEALADRVVAAGVREVRGQVQGDDSRYDKTRSVSSWPQRYLDDNEVGPLSALSVNDGFALWDPELVAFENPAVGAATVFTELLRARGVAIAGEPSMSKAPEKSMEIAQIASPRMAELVSDLIRESDNGTAELLVKELGVRLLGEGSTTAGLKVVADALGEMGLSLEGTHLVDGSGLDPTNKVSCTVLQAVAAGIEGGGPIDRGLAVAGFTGTLTKRFLDNPAKGKLRAKTGSLNHVAALVGTVEGGQGSVLTFTQVLNDIATLAAARDIQDDLGAALARYPEVPALESLAPLGPIAPVDIGP